MNNFLKTKFFAVILTVAISLCIIPSTLTLMGYGSYVKNAVGIVISPFEMLLGSVGRSIRGFTDYFTEFERLEKENAELKAQLGELREELYEASIHKEENEWLRTYLDLKYENTSFTMANAKIIGRQSTNIKTIYTLNRGSAAGIKVNMPVITNEGVVGYTVEVGLTWSKAVAITDQRSSVGVITNRTGAIGVLRGSYELSLEGRCEIVCTDYLANIKAGDKVLTSGLGSVYPEGLCIGEVTEVYRDKYDRSLHAVVKPGVSFEEISDVMILCDFEIKEAN